MNVILDFDYTANFNDFKKQDLFTFLIFDHSFWQIDGVDLNLLVSWHRPGFQV